MSNIDSGTLLAHLFESASKHPDRPALLCGDDELSWAKFRSRILSTATRLHSMGVGPGDRVLISGTNSLPIPILYFAIHALGAIVVPVAVETPGITILALAEDCEAKLAVVEQTLSGMPCPVEGLAQVTAPGDENIKPVCRYDTAADILYTTGTTGKKKGVVLTQSNVFSAARNISEFVGMGADDLEVLPLPLNHSFGLGRLRSQALVGHTIIIEPGIGIGVPVIRRLLSSRATGLALVPAGFDILRQFTKNDLGKARDHLRYIEIGSASMKKQTRDWLMEMLPNTRICHHYGLTEASRTTFTEYHADQGKKGTAGRASACAEITICDENFNRLGAGESGEIVVQGGMVMKEYWRQPELTQGVHCAHGFRTGDFGYLDPDGYLFLQGRKSDMINVGGRKVVPEEVEEALRMIDGVLDAACVGKPDKLLGEQVKAYIVADRLLDKVSVKTFLRERLEEYKIPKTFEVADKLPRSSSGKLQRNLLRQDSQEQAV
jgi:long-chain acyl-CoA synthetase